MAIQIKEDCKNFLREELNIELSVDKTKITNVTQDDVRFLGVDIRRTFSAESKIVARLIKGRLVKSRINRTRLYFYMPVNHILEKLQKEGYIKSYTTYDGVTKLVPNAITKWIFLDHRTVILRYNSVIRGLINYYNFVDNLYSFHSIVNLFLHHSCAKTLARKFNLLNRAQAFNKFGRYLEAPGVGKAKPVKLYTLENFRKKSSLLAKHIGAPADPFEVMN